MLTGRPDRSARLDGVPPELATTVRRCLATDPAERPTAAELERHLRGDRSAAPTRIIRPVRRPRAPLVLAACATAAIAGGVVAAVVTSSGSPSRPAPPRPARIAQIPRETTAQQQARSIAAWLVRYSR